MTIKSIEVTSSSHCFSLSIKTVLHSCTSSVMSRQNGKKTLGIVLGLFYPCGEICVFIASMCFVHLSAGFWLAGVHRPCSNIASTLLL